MDGVRVLPQERVQNRLIYTRKVFTVRHHRDDQACADNVVFIKGLHKHDMPRSGDVMVPTSDPDCFKTGFHSASWSSSCTELFKASPQDKVQQRSVDRILVLVVKAFSPGQASTATHRGFLPDIARSWEAFEAGLPPAALFELQEARRRYQEHNDFVEGGGAAGGR